MAYTIEEPVDEVKKPTAAPSSGYTIEEPVDDGEDKYSSEEVDTEAKNLRAGRKSNMARFVPGKDKSEPEKPATAYEKLKGAYEASRAALQNPVAGAAGMVAGAYKGATGHKTGTQEGLQEAQQTMEDVTQKLGYSPPSAKGQEYYKNVQDLVPRELAALPAVTGEMGAINAASKLSAPVAMAQTETVLAPEITMAGKVIDKGADVAESVIKKVTPKKKQMAGVGAAEVEMENQRVAKAANLDVPITLTKGQRTRSHEQQKFEKETAKLAEGEPLRQKFSDDTSKVLQNFDKWFDATGAEESTADAPQLRAIGRTVDAVVTKKAIAKKKAYGAEYDKAEAAGEMREPVDYSEITKYLEDQRPTVIDQNPVLRTVREELAHNDPEGTGKIPLNAMEDIRKLINRETDIGSNKPNWLHGKKIKEIVDNVTQNAGGDVYKRARKMRQEFAAEFEDHAVISKLLKEKTGTTDRSVAFEDVLHHTIFSGSLDDVRHVRRLLQTAGDDGKQAWKELQGGTLAHIREEITKNTARDVNGLPTISVAKLDGIVRELDKDGKLDYIFGKQGAQKLRDINDLAKDIYTAPPGSVNYSGTASILIGMFDTVMSGLSGVPLPVGTALHQTGKYLRSRNLKKKVAEAIGTQPEIHEVPQLPMSAAKD